MTAVLSGLILAATLALVLTRPWNISEAWWAALGGVAVLVAGLVSFGQAIDVVVEVEDALFLLVGMMALGTIAEKAGLFDWIAALAARIGRGRVWLLYVMVFVVGSLVTAILSLDATAIVLTPIVYGMVLRLRLSPLPFMFACAYTANTASLFLPVSNLTNLLFYNTFGLGFLRFGAVMLLPAVLAVTTNLALFALIFHRELKGSYEVKAGLPQIENQDFFRLALGGIGAALAAFCLSPIFGAPIGFLALLIGGITALVAQLRGWTGVREVASGVSWGLIPLVISLFLVIRAAENAGLSGVVRSLFVAAAPGDGFFGMLGIAGGATLGSNLVNNVPMAVMALSGISGPLGDGVLQPAAAYATLIGTNIGPNLTVVGSLATLIWLSLVRDWGVEITARDYLKIGIVSTPIIVVAAVFGLWVSLKLIGG